MIRKIYFSNIFCVLVMVIMTGSLKNTPLQILNLNLELVIILTFYLLAFYYFFFEIKNSNLISKKYLFVLITLPFFYAIISYVKLSQPIFDSIRENYFHFGFLISIYLYYKIKNSTNTLIFFENSIVALGFFFALSKFIIIIIYGLDYTFYINSFDGSSQYITSVLKHYSPFVAWGGLILVSRFIIKGKIYGLIFGSILVLSPIIYSNSRTYIFSLLFLIFLFFLFSNLKSRARILIISILIISIIIFISFISLDFLDFINQKFDIFSALLLGLSSSNQDLSIAFRAIQIEQSISLIQNNYLFGLGFLTKSTLLGLNFTYFHFTDIGIYAILMYYGFFGLIIFSYPIYIFLKFIRRDIFYKNSLFAGSILYFVLKVISFIFNGVFITEISLIFMILAILLYSNEKVSNSNNISKL